MRIPHAGMAVLVGSFGLIGCGDDESGKKNPPGPDPVPAINLLSDANRDGLVDDADDELEHPWSVAGGAVFLANIDDDNGDHILDGDTPPVDIVVGVNNADHFDIAPLDVRAWPDAPAEAVGGLTIDGMAMPHVRLHKLLPDGNWLPVFDAEAVCEGVDPICDNLIVLSTQEIVAGVRLGVEGRRLAGVPTALSVDPAGQTVPWNGVVDFAFSVYEKIGDVQPIVTEDLPDGIDRVQMRVAPWLMNGNLTREIDTVYSNTVPNFQGIGTFAQGIQAAADAVGLNYRRIDDYSYSHWTQDWMITGFASMPFPDGAVHGMRLAYPRPFDFSGTAGLATHWLADVFTAADHGYFIQYNMPNTGNSYDSGGNHEAIPPYSNNGVDYPVGRIMYGSGVLAETKAFYEAQLVQAPALTVPTSWLIVGHVDEFSSFVPAATERGWKLLIASPALMVTRLEELSAQGHGAVAMFEGLEFFNGVNAATTIDEALADTSIMAWSQEAQGHIDGVLAMMVAEIGLTPDEIIEIPFLWEKDGGLVAWNPGTVNSFVTGDLIGVPDPHGPVINGVDVFQQDLIDILGTPQNALGSEGQGMQVFFVDDWYAYHNNLGEVHCGTNMTGPPPADQLWWEAAQ